MADSNAILNQKIELTPDRHSILMQYLRTELNKKEGLIPVTNEFTLAAPTPNVPAGSNYVMQGFQNTATGVVEGYFTGPSLNGKVLELKSASNPAPMTTKTLVGLDVNRPIDPETGAISSTMNPDLAQNVQIVRVNFIVGSYGSPTNPDWKARYDEIVDGYVNRGIQVYGLIGHEITNYPDMLLLEPNDSAAGRAWIAEYVRRFGEVVAHFDNRVTFWESYNEPSAYHDVAKKPILHPYWFALLLKEVYKAVKVDRGLTNLTLISGPLFAHTLGGGPLGNPNAISAQVVYLRDTFSRGKKQHGWNEFKNSDNQQTYPLDGLGYHLYVHETENVPATQIKATLESYLNQIYAEWLANDAAAIRKKIYVSEFGWQANKMGEEEQKARMTTAFRVFLNDPRVGAAFWFCTQGFNNEEWGIYPSDSLTRLKACGMELKRIAALARAGTPAAIAPQEQPLPMAAFHHGNGNGNGASPVAKMPAWSPTEEELTAQPVSERLAYVQDKRQQHSQGVGIVGLAPSDLVAVPVADQFQFPFGRGNEPVLQRFKRDTDFVDEAYHSTSSIWHPGEDWNLLTGGDSDLGEPVYATANGKVIDVGFYSVWGNVVLVEHQLPNGERVWSQYAHLNEKYVFKGDIVRRGDGIGTMGKGENGQFSAHLHFEIRKVVLPANHWKVNDRGYVVANYHNPTAFIQMRQAATARWAHDVVVDSQNTNPHAGTYNSGGTQTWYVAPKGYLGHTRWTYTSATEESNWAEWHPKLRDAGEYEVFVYVPGNYATTTNAQYRITHAQGQHTVSVNQEIIFDKWVSLGRYIFNGNNSGSVWLGNETDETDARQIAFDAVRWVRLV